MEIPESVLKSEEAARQKEFEDFLNEGLFDKFKEKKLEKIKAEMQKRCPEYTQFAIVDTDFSN